MLEDLSENFFYIEEIERFLCAKIRLIYLLIKISVIYFFFSLINSILLRRKERPSMISSAKERRDDLPMK